MILLFDCLNVCGDGVVCVVYFCVWRCYCVCVLLIVCEFVNVLCVFFDVVDCVCGVVLC